jgi:glycosyltransferase involved in cell wall biosynthesis
MAKFVTMLRVKNGMLFLPEWLERMSKLTDECVVVDNGSTDGTYEMLREHPLVVSLDRTEGFHEGRDKQLAYRRARERNAEWILFLDVDEIFERRLQRADLDHMMGCQDASRHFFRLFNIIGDGRQFEGGLQKLWAASWPLRVLWRDQPGGWFNDAHIHSGLINGIAGRSSLSHFRIRHLGTLHREYFERKTKDYLQVDPARGPMYVRYRDETTARTAWLEYDENMLSVNVLNLTLDAMFAARYSLRAMRNLMSNFPGRQQAGARAASAAERPQ